MSGKVEVTSERDGDACETVSVIYELGKACQLLRGGDGAGAGVGILGVPAGVGGAVPGADGVCGPCDSGREERGCRKRERSRDDTAKKCEKTS